MCYKSIIVEKISKMPDEVLVKLLIFIAGMEAQRSGSFNLDAK